MSSPVSTTRLRRQFRQDAQPWSYQTVQWVNRELASTIADAHKLLERFTEERADVDLMRRFANLMHTAFGALRMVDIQGGTLLVEEMEAVARELEHERIASTDDGLDALTRAIVQLPAYVERIIAGERDVPLQLLPLLNDLRAVRGSPLLSESTLFILDVPAGSMPADFGGRAADQDIRSVMARLHPHFQVALLGWLQDRPDAARCLARMSAVAESVLDLTRVSSLAQLFWVVCAVVEALQDGGLAPGASVKRLMGQAERQLRRLVTEGEATFEHQPATDLLSNLLYYIARASSSGERVTAVKQAFALQELMPEGAELDGMGVDLGAPSAELMGTVAEAIRQDIGRIKDVLECVVREEAADLASLGDTLGEFKRLADTLRVLGLGDLALRVEGERDALQGLIHGGDEGGREGLLDIAAVLLAIEDQLDQALAAESLSGAAQETEGAGSQEFRRVVAAVMRECTANLSQVQDALNRFARDPQDREPLAALPALMQGVASALGVLEREQAAHVAQRIRRVLAGPMFQVDAASPDEQCLDRLADALVSLEYFLETVGAGRPDPTSMLDSAVLCLELIDPETTSAGEGPVPDEVLSRAEAVGDPAGDEVPIEAAGDEAPIEAPCDEAPAALPDGGPGDQPAQASDPELVGVFLEEAEETVALLEAALPAWQADRTAGDTLESLRRGFHTLKGGSRMIGAVTIGEVARCAEEVCSGLANGRLAMDDESGAFLADATAALTGLIGALAGNGASPDDVDGLLARAEQLGGTSSPTRRPTAETAEKAETVETAETAIVPGEEPVTARAAAATAPSAGSATDRMAGDGPGAGASTAEDAPCEEREPRVFQQSVPLLLELRDAATTALDLVRDSPERPGAGSEELEALRQGVALAVDSLDAILAADAAATPAQAVACWQRLERLAANACVDALEVLSEVTWRYLAAGGLDAPVHFPEGAAELLDAVRSHAADWVDALANDGPTADQTFDPAALIARVHRLPSPEKRPEEVGDAPLPVAGDAPAGAPAMEAVPVDYDETLVEIFTEEAGELLERADELLTQWRADRHGTAPLEELKRVLHTLKGGARMAGIGPVGDVSHELESLLLQAGDDGQGSPESLLALVQATVDRLNVMREDLVARRPIASATSTLAAIRALAGPEQACDDATSGAPAPDAGRGTRAAGAGAVDNGASAALGDGEAPARAVDNGASAALGDGEASAATAATPDPAVEAAATTARALDAATGETGTAKDDALDMGMPPAPAARPATAAPASFEEPAGAAAPAAGTRERQEAVRVAATLLNELLNDAGEVSILRSRLEQKLTALGFHVGEFGQTVDRVRAQLRQLELETERHILAGHRGDQEDAGARGAASEGFDPLELDRYSSIQQLSRALAESMNDLVSLQEMLEGSTSEAENLLMQQARAAGDLQAALMRTRMVPFSRHASRLRRIVRQTCAETGKQAELLIDGGDGELDRQILERMLPPLEHMLRNAVVHGVEPGAGRQAAGKPVRARITITLWREGAEMVIEVADDGAGLDVEAIRRRGLAAGLIREGESLTDREVMELVFRPGFSTADQVTQAAGRGVGMDVVASEVRKLGGMLDFESVPGAGTRFVVRLPFTLAITQALLVEAAGEGYAIPLPAVEGIVRLPTPEVERHLEEAGPVYEYGDQRYRFALLGRLLGNEHCEVPDTTTTAAILVRAGERSTALVVDAMHGNREIVVKAAGPQIAAIRGVAGATVLGDGSLRLILDVGALVRGGAVRRASPDELPSLDGASRPLALVVDDSITVRRITSRFLERNGMRVLTARDGIEAIAVMEDELPDVILLDIEMPRMDGYEVVSHVRKHERLRNVPIVMVTSRVGEKHRARGLALGVNDYLGKPYQEAQLLAAVDPLLERPRRV